MRAAAHLPFVPGVLRTPGGGTFVSEAGRVWDVTRWKPGAPRESPTLAEIEAAAVAAARLHAAWPVSNHGPCPGVLNRLRMLGEWTARPAAPDEFRQLPEEIRSLLRRAGAIASALAPQASRALRPWAGRSLPLRACLRDLRGDHVLFTGAEVTGIIDYGATAEDHPAVDLARLLGDFAGEDDGRFAAGLRAYRETGGLFDVPEEFARLLDRTGVVCSVLGWMRRLLVERRTYADTSAVARRLGGLLARSERVSDF
jgi:aminoglycoside phosphotransferase (APT) family kinase protein